MTTKVFASKERAISELIESANSEKRNLYLRKIRYGSGESYEYSIVPPEEVMRYDADNYIGHYLYNYHQWVCFDSADRITTLRYEGKRKDTIVIPVLSSERPGFFE
jgi:hypothetical protein